MPKKRIEDMTKPVKPTEPKYESYRHFARHLGAKNIHGDAVTSNPEFVSAYEKYQADSKAYEEGMIIWEQLRLIKRIKKSTFQTCIDKYNIELK